MGHSNNPTPQLAANYNQSRGTASQETDAEKRKREFDESLINWGESGDYREPPPEAKVFFNFADPAERKRHNELYMNAGAQGTAALGGAMANPTVLALNRENMANEDAEDAAKNYQDTASRLVGGAYGDLGDIAQMDQARNLNIFGTDANVYNSQLQRNAQRIPWWQRFLDNAAQGAGAAAAAP